MSFKEKRNPFKPPKRVALADVEDAVKYFDGRDLDVEYGTYAHATAVRAADYLLVNKHHRGGDVVQYHYMDLHDKPIMDDGFPYIRGRRLKAFGDNKMIVRKGTANHLFLPKLRMIGKFAGYTWEDVAKDPEVPIFHTEGEPKALALAQRGLAVIATSGVCNYKSKVRDDGLTDLGSDWCVEFEWIEWEGREVQIVPDYDALTRRDLRPHLGKVAGKYREKGSHVSVIELTPVNGDVKTGVDDYIKAFGYKPKRDDDPGPPAFMSLPRIPISDTRYLNLVEDLQPVSLKHTGTPAEWLEQAMPPEEWVLENYIPAEPAVGLLVAEGGAGKTYLGLQLAICIAGGIPFLDNVGVEKGRVLFLAAEDRQPRLRRRVKRIIDRYVKGMNEKKEERFREDVQSNLNVRSTVGRPLHLLEMRSGAVVQSAAVARTVADVRDEGYVLIIPDPLARFHGLEENPNHISTAVIEAFETVSGAAGCPSFVSHHTGKGKDMKSQYAARGGSGLPDGARFIINLEVLDEEGCRKVGITDAEQVRLGVVAFRHAKAFAKRQKTKYLKRLDDGFLESFDPDFTNDSPEVMLAAFCAYFDKNLKLAGLSEREVSRDKRKAIFGKDAPSREDCVKWFNSAIADDFLELAGHNSNNTAELYRPSKDAHTEAAKVRRG